MARKLNITPDKSLIKKLGLTGYRTKDALAELIDNSIDARIGEKELVVEITLDYVEKKIVIEDNGRGMDIHELEDALIIAKEKKRSKAKLGQFGIGMKSACSRLGKQFIITTCKSTSDKILVAKYDEDEWLKDEKKTWEDFLVEEKTNDVNWHGTNIEITKINVALYPNQLTNLRKHFGYRYATYIKNGLVVIKINSLLVKPSERSLEPGTKRNITLKMTSSPNIVGWIALALRRTATDKFGFDLYRNNRLIISNSKIGIRSHPEISRIVGELHFNDIPVNFNKTEFLMDSALYKEAENSLEKSPYLQELLDSESYASKKNESATLEKVNNYLHGTKPSKLLPLKMQVGANKAKQLINNVQTIDFVKNFKNVSIDFLEKDEHDSLYTIDRSNQNIIIHVNKNNPSFLIFKNPLFLLGLIQIESKIIAENLKIDEFLQKRNEQLTQFALDFLPKEKIKSKKIKERKEVELDSLYGLADELTDLHYFLHEKYEHRFQFTALSTLYAYLEYGLSNMLYTIYAENKTGRIFLDFINDNYHNSNKFGLLLNPSRNDIEKAFNISKEKPFLIIREYNSSELTKTIADPNKAWMDFFREIKTNHIPLSEDELLTTLDALNELSLISKQKIYSLANHRNNLSEIELFTEQIFGNNEK